MGPNRTNEEAAEARARHRHLHLIVVFANPAIPIPKDTEQIINYLTSFSQQAFSMVAWNIVAGSELLSSTSVSRIEQKNACAFVLWRRLWVTFGFNLNYGTKTCDAPETQEQNFEAAAAMPTR